ncbi:Deoxyhypusine synthase [Helianthus anomalus]
MEEAKVIENLRSVVFKESESLEGACSKINGYDFNKGVDYSQILKSLLSTGFQASNLGDAIQTVNQMLDWRLSHEQVTEDCSDEEKNPTYRESVKCKIFLGFTSNLISSGVRDVIRYLVQHHMVEVIVTTAGGIEEDLIKCLGDTYRGDFSLPGAALRSKGLNRIGNLLVPNDNYCKFEDWIIPIFDQMLIEQNTQHVLWTPSKVIARLGKEINNESSYLYWAYKNDIPVFCPGLTDGSLGDMLYFHSFRNPGLVVDIVQVFINTAQEFDGSDSGARPDEAVSWGKIRASAKSVKNDIPVFCPGLTDGSLGDMLYFHSFRNPGLVVDIVQDIRAMNGEAVHANPRKTGMIILGGGLPKHHICNANMMRNGADYAVFINTAQEFDGSDSGARPDEAVSWGKIRASAKSVKVHCDATIAFPLLVAETFAAKREKNN